MKFDCCPPAAGAGIMQVSIRPITMKGIPPRYTSLRSFKMEVFLEEPRSRRGEANIDEEAAEDEASRLRKEVDACLSSNGDSGCHYDCVSWSRCRDIAITDIAAGFRGVPQPRS